MNTTKRKEEYIVIAIYLLVALQLVFDSILETATINKICRDWAARKFLSELDVVPFYSAERHVIACVCFACECLITLLRKKLCDCHIAVRYAISFLYLGLCILMMLCVNDVQGILVMTFIVCLLTLFKGKNRWFWLAVIVTVFILLGTDYFESVYVKFSFDTYINYYHQEKRELLFAIHSILSSLLVASIIGYLLVSLSIRTTENITISKMNALLSETTEELQRSNKALKEYSEKVEELSKTKERNRIAREIHDTLGHTLTGIASSIEVCQELTGNENEIVHKYLNASREMALSGLEDVRRSLNKLRPDLLEKADLDTALKTMINRFSDAQKVAIHYNYSGEDVVFSDDEKETIFRIIQESMTNSVRHGHSENITVSVAVSEDSADLEVLDDGVNTGEIMPGFGIHHMQERAEMLGGKVEVESCQMHGTRVHAIVPIRRMVADDTSADC